MVILRLQQNVGVRPPHTWVYHHRMLALSILPVALLVSLPQNGPAVEAGTCAITGRMSHSDLACQNAKWPRVRAGTLGHPSRGVYSGVSARATSIPSDNVVGQSPLPRPYFPLITTVVSRNPVAPNTNE